MNVPQSEIATIRQLRDMLDLKVKEIGQMREENESLRRINQTLAVENYELKKQCNQQKPAWFDLFTFREFLN